MPLREQEHSMWPISNAVATAIFERERRASPRRIVGEAGELYIPMEDMRLACTVVNMSVGGAKIACDIIPSAGAKVILLFKGRSINAAVAWYCDEELGLKFTAP
jgi:hypothetical protein